MSKLQIPEFKTYEEKATFWDNLDTADFMEDDGIHFFTFLCSSVALCTHTQYQNPMQYGTRHKDCILAQRIRSFNNFL